MKKFKIASALAFILMFSSCDDYLDNTTKSTLGLPATFESVILTQKAIDGIIVSMGETESYRGRFLPWYGTNSDIEWYNSSTGTDAKSDLAKYSATPSNLEMNKDVNAWAKMYEGIEKANLCIKGLRNSGKYKTDKNFAHLLAEALTLRAVLYADLVKAWGDVPARFEPLTSETIYIPKADRDVIYKQIIEDLGEAAEMAYWPLESVKYTSQVNRVNKSFVKGLRARIALNAAGYSQRPDSETPRLSNDPELSKEVLYPIILQDLLDVYNYPGGGKLEESFRTVFYKLCQEDYMSGGEGLWNIPLSKGRGRMAYTFAIRHNAKDQYTEMAAGAQIGPTPHLFYDYDVNDTRRDVTCVPYDWSNSSTAKQQLRSLSSWCFGKYRFEWMNRIVTSAQDDGLQKQYMRYAEILLMLAEVENYLNGPGAAAPYLKEIRERAFPKAMWQTKVEGYVDSKNTKEAMFDAIVDEYAFEFAGEMIRKETLIRWNLLGKKLADSKVRMDELRKQTGRYTDVPSKLYWKYAEDGETLIVYGLNRGENMDMSAEYPTAQTVDWVGTGKINDEKIKSLYSVEPDKRQFWPIWKVFINSSNGMLKNSYGYENEN